MAGSILAAGLVAVTATLCVGLAAVGGAAVTGQRTAAAADAAALAASDIVTGAVASDDPACAVAAQVADAAGGRLTSCELHGPVATVEVRAAYAGLSAVARARAGPPE
ncbi:Rv3654c family TadE-like protein [Microbacterium sp. NIBRBAC000506063]|uniref:Rv3654c family TadE-like protein n=1 Tax=Microbacterium sp. NIBRBAC000506063 TaxID=2734618 RepID=UPI001BB5706F|nr:Rv3654c family TadE-like protein [Microbacterium sp. NIBRBAC000506063]QTV80041.1 helicase [Microbacterium sp. NIBRBAC000506063]